MLGVAAAVRYLAATMPPERPKPDRAHPLFLCYRQADTLKETADLQTSLDLLFGPSTAFRDEASVEWGSQWPETLRAALQAASAVLVVIGPDWLKADDVGLRRIDEADDWVRQEIATALASGKPIYPVLIRGAQIPPARARLPADIAGLSERQADSFSIGRWAEDLGRLADRLTKDLGLQRIGGGVVVPPRHDPLPAYRAHLRQRHEKLVTFAGTGHEILKAIYVEVALTSTARAARSPLDTRPPDVRTLRQLLAPDAAADPDLAATPAWEVLGEPGAGKSTLLRYLAFELGDEAAPPSTPIPVYVPLAALAQHKCSPLQFAEDELRAVVDAEADGLAKRLLELAGKGGEPGRVWLLLDGLDEVDPKLLPAMRDRLRALPALFPCARLVVTARPVGHQALGSDFGRAALQPLDAKRQRDLLTAWLRSAPPGSVTVDDLLARVAARPALAPILRNPLLLTMVARLAIEKQALPANRAELLARAVDLLLAKPYNPDALPIEAPTEARAALRALALRLTASPDVSWSKETLVKALQAASVDVSPWRTRDALLDQLGARTGILAPYKVAAAPWHFLHRQFREVLAAEALREIVAEGGSWQACVGKLDKDAIARWSETLGMFCAFAPSGLGVLEALREADVGATMRALPMVEGVEPAQLLEFLWATPAAIEPAPPAYEPQHHWDGDDLAALVDAWLAEGRIPAPRLSELLWQRVTPATDLDRLAWLHFALTKIAPMDRQRFFGQIGRPLVDASALGIVWVDVPAGQFLMGSPGDEPQRVSREGPQHTVTLPGFRLAKCVVTNGQYGKFDQHYEPRAWPGVSAEQLAHHPAVLANWWRAYLFCAWLGARLPSEAEWEYACRAGTTTPFSFGANITPDQVNYDGNRPYADGKKGKYRERTVAVGSLPANAWGLHEMHGNVWEWCEDAMRDNYDGAPTDGSAWLASGSRGRVLRGGSWFSYAGWCRSACRNAGHPGLRGDGAGFRPASSSLTPFTPSPPA